MPSTAGASDVIGKLFVGSDLAMTAGTFLATASPKDLTAVYTAVPETVVVLVRLSSGTATLTADLTADGVYSSADATITNFNDTTYHAIVLDTTAALPYINVRLATSANAIVDRLAVIPLALLTAGEDWFNVRDGLMAVANTTNGDGSGAFGSVASLSA
jgi:hypothetical protein